MCFDGDVMMTYMRLSGSSKHTIFFFLIMKSSLPVIYNCIIIIERKVVFPNLALV